MLLFASIAFVMTRPRVGYMLGALALMILTTFISALMTRYPAFNWSVYIMSLNQIVVPMLFLSARPTIVDRDFVLRMASWVPITCAVLGLLYQAAGIRNVFGYEYGSGLPRFQGSLIPALFAGFTLSGSVAAMKYAHLVNRRYLWLACINIVLLVLSGSRVPTAIALVLCAFIFYTNFNGQRRLKVMGTIIAGVGMVILLSTVGSGIIERFSQNGLSGRDVMWSYLEIVLAQYSDFGIGFGHQMSAVPREVLIVTGSTAAHNDYLRLALELGYGGAIAFYALFMGSVLLLWNSHYQRRDPLMLMGAISFFILSLTDNALAAPSHFPLLLITTYSTAKFGQSAETRRRPAGMQGPGLRPLRGYA
ncbi:O-antigen ligase family protein [Kaistia dalseonensis]|uniref:O-antigen ligase n=1 Tax=Kaistia dalseonensis TaxID=410840 RepID=A0ABU0H210_9HYPH|nr:O-antigen ligase family protein [Kaistia dalseonensis]MCX5493777.1 O-antigen ligase family protein [Kaistia dalseonensis]MDQ0436341.1 O-antigen ligase [Kaistia dalseonensis]